MLGQLDTFIAFALVILGVSLLITVLNHILTAAIGLRGMNLRWGLETLFQQVDGRLTTDARRIADEILQHPLICDSTMSNSASWPVIGKFMKRWRMASAIKLGELVEILRKLAVPVPAGGATDWRQRVSRMLADHDAQTAARFTAAAAAVNALNPEAIKKIDELAPQVAAQVRHAVGDLELWFDAVMDRVSQRYAARMRVFTVVFAALLAFTLHLDAAILLDQLRSDPDLRARLVASTDAMSKEADLVLGTSVPSVYRRAAERLQAETVELKDAGQAPEFFTETEGIAWVMKGLATAGEVRRNEVRQRYHALVREELSSLTGTLSDDVRRIRQQLEGAGLQLIPDYAKHTRADKWPDWLPLTERTAPANVSTWNRHFFGILASVALLSLGAPFWFNALKTATTLRPIVATKEKEDRAQRT